ncbi:hypothetical protein D3C86_1999760 [compost metagenome]
MAKRTAMAAEPADRPPTSSMDSRKVASKGDCLPSGSFREGSAGGLILGRASLKPLPDLGGVGVLLPLISRSFTAGRKPNVPRGRGLYTLGWALL